MARPSRWDDVVKSAARVFSQRGFANATLEEIAESIGMLKGSLYNYISSKEDLLAAVIDVPAQRLISATAIVVASDEDSAAKIRTMIATHIDVIVDVYDFAAVYLHEVARQDLDDQWRKIDRKYVRLVESVVKEAIADGTFRPDLNAHVATMSIIGACNWLTRWWNPSGAVGRTALVRQMSDILLAGMAADPASIAIKPTRPARSRS